MKTKYKHLYVVTRRDLTPGYQGVQSQHALVEFAHMFPDAFRKWKEDSNYLCWVSVKDLTELRWYAKVASYDGIKIATFHEPDIDFDMTAFAAEPGAKSARLFKPLDLALAPVVESPKPRRKR